MIEDEAKRQKKPAFDILIDEWGTSGKQRPTIRDLIYILAKVELYQAADYLSVDVLGEDPVERPINGPSAIVPSNTEDIHLSLQTTFHLIDEPVLEATNEHFNERLSQTKESATTNTKEFDTPLPQLSYAELEHITNNFDLIPIAQNGRQLGAGAFGTVFLGKLTENNAHLDSNGVQIYKKLKLSLQDKVAVKRLHSQKVPCN